MSKFSNGGIIRHNDRFEQEKISKYHHLVTMLVLLFNAQHMTEVLESLKQEGYSIVLEELKHISPQQLRHQSTGKLSTRPEKEIGAHCHRTGFECPGILIRRSARCVADAAVTTMSGSDE